MDTSIHTRQNRSVRSTLKSKVPARATAAGCHVRKCAEQRRAIEVRQLQQVHQERREYGQDFKT